MIPLSIRSATEVYGNVSKCEIFRHWVDHPILAEFSHTLRSFIRSLEDQATDEFWKRSLGPIRRLGFIFCSTPLPFSKASEAAGIDWAQLHRQVFLCKKLFPDAHETLANLVQQLEILSAEINSPYYCTLEQINQQEGELAVVLRNPRMNQSVADFFAQTPSLRTVKVVSPSQLRGNYLCNMLATIGPCGWFPEHIFSAPRTTAIHVISPRWIRDLWKPGPIFLHNSNTSSARNRSHRIGILPRVRGEIRPENDSITDLLPIDLLPPRPNFDNTGRSFAGQSDNREETVPAHLCYLSGERAVFVAADDGSSSLVIDTSEMGNATVRRVSSEELEEGHYLLVRTSGGGDFIVPLADRIMGNLAEKRRSEQAEWKVRLLSVATEWFGPLGRRELAALISAELQSQNLSQARPANVYYWMSSKCIRPRKIEDFVAILTFAGLRERYQELWSAMNDIDRAHRKAGHTIRRMLLSKISTTSIEQLERDGEMVFELGDEDGGSLSAFQIIEIVTEDYEISSDRLGVLFEMEA